MNKGKDSCLYLLIQNPDTLLEGCEVLLRGIVKRLIEGQINGYTTYTDEKNVRRVKVNKIVIEYFDDSK